MEEDKNRQGVMCILLKVTYLSIVTFIFKFLMHLYVGKF